MNYGLSLINVWWSKNDINARFFDSLASQNSYFDSLAQGKISPCASFDYRDGVNTTCYYKDKSNRSIEELLKCNYLILYKYNDNNEIILRRYYFANPYLDSSHQLRVDLDLDDIQTNYFNNKENLKDVTINRANLNRFVLRGNKYYFNNNKDSKLYLNEGFNSTSKLPVWREKLELTVDKYDKTFNDWIHENIKGWVYIFCDNSNEQNAHYKIYDIGQNSSGLSDVSRNITSYNVNGNKMATGILCYPIYNNGKVIKCKCNNTYTVIDYKAFSSKQGDVSLTTFTDNNADKSYIYSMKVSIKPPFFNIDAENKYSIDNNGDLILDCDYYSSIKSGTFFNTNVIETGISLLVPSSPVKYGLFTACNDDGTPIETYSIVNKFNPLYDGITSTYFINNPNKDFKNNPKTYSNDMSSLKIYCNGTNFFEYDVQAIGYNHPSFKYYEVIMPEVSKIYVTLYPKVYSVVGGLYNEIMNKNYFGLIENQENSLAYSNSQYANFIANNKNFWLQTQIGFGENLLKSIAGGALTSGLIGAVGGTLGGIIGGIETTINKTLSLINLQSSPQQMQSSNGNVLLNLSVADMGIYCEFDRAIDVDLEKFYDETQERGYAYNQHGDISDFDNIRKYFNYIEASVGSITGDLNNVEKERLKNKLLQIRFWNSDNIQYNLDNYERIFDNE